MRGGLPDRREIFWGFVSFESTSSTSMAAIVSELVDWMSSCTGKNGSTELRKDNGEKHLDLMYALCESNGRLRSALPS